MGEEPSVLIVEADPIERERFGCWFEEAGRQVILCPGPSAPDYTCVGSREGICPLVEDAELVVLDMATESESVMAGVASEELLALYLAAGRRVIALGSHPGGDIPGVLVKLPRHPQREELLLAAKSLG